MDKYTLFSDYISNPDYHTYGNRHNTYSYDQAEDFKRVLDYVVFRKPRSDALFDVTVSNVR